jgi:hypothetical protein
VWPCQLVQKQQSNNQLIICNQQPSPINLPNIVNWHMASVGTETAIIGSQRQATIISINLTNVVNLCGLSAGTETQIDGSQ